MMIGSMLRQTKVVRSKIKRNSAFKKLNGKQLGLVLVAVAFFGLVYAAEFKAIVSLESSQDLFEVVPNQLLYR
jgi:hypothetical protein